MASWNYTPGWSELSEIMLEQATRKVGLTAEQFNKVMHNLQYLKNSLGLANVEIGEITTIYTEPGTKFDVDISHREVVYNIGVTGNNGNALVGSYEVGEKIDFFDFTFHVAVAKITTEMQVERVNSDTLSNMELESSALTGEDENKGYHFKFKAKLPKSGITKEEISDGKEGDVLFVNPNGLPHKKQIMSESPVVDNAEDLANAKNTGGTSFSDILANWGRFSHFQGNYNNAIAGDVNGWAIDTTTGSITNSVNSQSHIGFYSPDKVLSLSKKVKFLVTDSSSKTHLDTLSFVAAFCKSEEQTNIANLDDAYNHEHTLSFVRSPGPKSGFAKYAWALIVDLDYGYDSLENENCGAFTLFDGSEFITNKNENGLESWGNGAFVKVVRQNNVFTGYTSEFDENELLEDSKIELNLDDMTITTKNGVINLSETLTEQQLLVLQNFKQANHWGYGSASQPYCLYEQQGGIESEYIFDILNDETYIFNPNTGVWQATGINPIITLGAGRFANSLDKKSLYYNNGIVIYKVSAGGEQYSNKVTEITEENSENTEQYPSVSAVVTYVETSIDGLLGELATLLSGV